MNLENKVLEEVETFYDSLSEEIHNPLFFNILSEKHSHHICDLMQNVTNRKIKLIRARYATNQYTMSFKERVSEIQLTDKSTKIQMLGQCPERTFVEFLSEKMKGVKGCTEEILRNLWKDLRTYKPEHTKDFLSLLQEPQHVEDHYNEIDEEIAEKN